MVVNSLNDIDEFIKKANYESTSNKKLYFGKVNSKTSLKIKKQTGIMINNYNLSLKANAVKHIFKRHSNEKEKMQGQKAISVKDFYLLPEIVCNYDEIEKISVTKQGKPILMFIKKLGEVYYLINSISDKNYSLEVITMWKKIKRNLPLWIMYKPYPNVRNEQWYEFFLCINDIIKFVNCQFLKNIYIPLHKNV